MKICRFAWCLLLACSSSFAILATEGAEDADIGQFTDFCADAVVGSLNGRTWLVTDGFADSLLVSRAKARGIDLVVMPLRLGDPDVIATFEAAVQSLRNPKLDAAAALGTAPFILSWMLENPEEASAKLALLVEPSLARVVGFEAVPYGLVYQVMMPSDVSEAVIQKAMEKYLDVRDSLGEMISTTLEDKTVAAYAKRIRAQAAICGNNLGCLLYDAQKKDEALEVFSLAHSIDKGNISSLLNKASLVREGFKPELAEKLGQEMNEMVRLGGGSWTLASAFGYVLKPEEFIPAKWYWAGSGIAINNRKGFESFLSVIEDENSRGAVAQQLASSFAMQTAGAQPAMGLLKEFPAEGFTWQYMLRIAQLQIALGDKLRAVRIVERARGMPGVDSEEATVVKALVYSKVGRVADAVQALMAVKTPENSLRILMKVASVYSESGDTAKLALTLKEFASVTVSPTWVSPLLKALNAQLAGDVIGAKKLADEAVVTGADTDFAFRTALMLDMMASDKTSAAGHADSLLKLNPMDPFGNYVKATFFVDAKQYQEAEKHFQISLSQNASWYVLNDYAALAIETKRYEMAEMLARNAMTAGGERYAAIWDTLGTALMKMNREPEALSVFKDAVQKEGGDDPRIQLNYAEICFKQGDKATVIQALAVIDKRKEELSVVERERLGRLRDAVGDKTQ